MSVTWTSTVGYGFRINKELHRELSSNDEFLDDLGENIGDRYPLLEIAYAGSAYGAYGHDMEEWVLIKGSMAEAREWSQPFEMEKILNSLNEESFNQLYTFVADTGIVMGEPCWRMMLTQG